MHLKRVVLIVALLLVVMAPGTGMAAASVPARVFDGTGNKAAPRTDGRYVVWLDYRDGDVNAPAIYAADLTTGEISAVTTDAVQASAPAIDGGIVVWSEEHNDPAYSYDVVGLNLNTGERLAIATGGSQAAISGGWVVWVSGTSLMARDLASDAESITLATGGSIHAPVIDGDRVVWEDLQPGGERNRWQLLTMRLGDREPMVVFEGTPFSRGATGSFGFDVAGDTIVVIDTTFTLRAFDLDTGTETTATLPPYSGRPTTDGRYVAWHVHQPGPGWFDLRGYDLQTTADFLIAAGSEALPSAANMPDLSGGVLVWRQGGDTDGAIHAAPLGAALPTAPLSERPEPSDVVSYFPETGHTLQHGFRAFWEASGGLPTFGFPLTEEYREQNADTGEVYTVQFTERQRFEYHPEHAGTPYEVLLGRLGAELLTAQGRDWRDFPTPAPGTPGVFPETGHAIAPQFLATWSSRGLDLGDPGISFRESLALFGFPLSEPMMETNADGDTVLTQYFERAVFEHHPGNAAPYDVLLRRLGAETLAARGWLEPGP